MDDLQKKKMWKPWRETKTNVPKFAAESRGTKYNSVTECARGRKNLLLKILWPEMF